MVDLDALERSAWRAAAWSRARMAVRVVAAVGPLAVIAVAIGGDTTVCVCLAAALLGVTTGLRHRSRAGVNGARLGMTMGLVPWLASCGLDLCGVAVVPTDPSSMGAWVCLGAGLLSGAGVAWWADAIGGRVGPAAALLVAALTATLGCTGLGVGGAAVVVVGQLAAAALVRGVGPGGVA